MLGIVASYHFMQFQEKLTIQIRKNGKKPSFGRDFGPKYFFSWILVLTNIRHYCRLSLYAISGKGNEPNLRKWQKCLVSDSIFVHLVQIWAAKIVFRKAVSVSQ